MLVIGQCGDWRNLCPRLTGQNSVDTYVKFIFSIFCQSQSVSNERGLTVNRLKFDHVTL